MKLRPNVFTAKKTGKANWKTLDFLTYMYRVFYFIFLKRKKVKINIQPKCALTTNSKWDNDHFEGIFKDVTVNYNMGMKEMLSWILFLQNLFYFIFWGTFRRIDSSNVIVNASVR